MDSVNTYKKFAKFYDTYVKGFEEDICEEIKTYRRYVRKIEMQNLLTQAGFTNIMFTDGYDKSNFRSYSTGEEIACSYIAVAKK